MSRLTIRNGMFIEDGTRIQDFEGYHTTSSDANRFAKKEIYKLGQLEDVLEEFGIESAEELRIFCKEKERLKTELSAKVDYIHELVEIKEDYKQQLSKAIVPKFEIGQEAYAIIDTMAYRDVFPVRIVGANLVYEVDDGYNGTTLQHSSRIFKTKEEAEQKLKELGGERQWQLAEKGWKN